MIKLERYSVMNLENAIRGARNPLNSWAKSDSFYDENGQYVLGAADMSLAARLCGAGTDHRKFIQADFYQRGYYRSSVLVEGVRYL